MTFGQSSVPRLFGRVQIPTATSDLTEGPVPVFVGHHDGFWFSAIRLDDG